MTLEQKGVTIRELGVDATKFMDMLKESRNRHIELIDSGQEVLARVYKPDDATKQDWKAVQRKHYEDLLDVTLKLVTLKLVTLKLGRKKSKLIHYPEVGGIPLRCMMKNRCSAWRGFWLERSRCVLLLGRRAHSLS
jgi:hypothetical protein